MLRDILFTELFRNIETKRFFTSSRHVGCCSGGGFYVFYWLCFGAVVAIQRCVRCIGVVEG